MLVGLVILFTLFMFPCACRRFKILTECTTNWKKCPFCPLLLLFFPFLSVVIQCCVCSNLATFFGTILSLILIGWYLDCKVDPCDEFMTSVSLETYYEVPCSEVSRLVATSRRFYQEIFFTFYVVVLKGNLYLWLSWRILSQVITSLFLQGGILHLWKNKLVPGLGFLLFRKKHIMHIKCWKKKKHNRKEGYSTELKSLNHLSKPERTSRWRETTTSQVLKDRIHSYKGRTHAA